MQTSSIPFRAAAWGLLQLLKSGHGAHIMQMYFISCMKQSAFDAEHKMFFVSDGECMQTTLKDQYKVSRVNISDQEAMKRW